MSQAKPMSDERLAELRKLIELVFDSYRFSPADVAKELIDEIDRLRALVGPVAGERSTEDIIADRDAAFEALENEDEQPTPEGGLVAGEAEYELQSKWQRDFIAAIEAGKAMLRGRPIGYLDEQQPTPESGVAGTVPLTEENITIRDTPKIKMPLPESAPAKPPFSEFYFDDGPPSSPIEPSTAQQLHEFAYVWRDYALSLDALVTQLRGELAEAQQWREGAEEVMLRSGIKYAEMEEKRDRLRDQLRQAPKSERRSLITAVRILLNNKPGAALNAVSEDYPELVELLAEARSREAAAWDAGFESALTGLKEYSAYDEDDSLIQHIRLNKKGPQVAAPVDDESRCSVCGWPLSEHHCLRGNCSMRPLPARYYAPERVWKEYNGRLGIPPQEPKPPAAGGTND